MSADTELLLQRIAVASERTAAACEKLLAGRPAAAAGATGGAKPGGPAEGEVASDADLDGKFGDPEVKKDPPRWTGSPVAPCHMSQAPAAWLDVLAGFKDWQAWKNDQDNEVDAKGRPKSYYSRLDAARARGWAKRIRDGKVAPPSAPPANNGWGNSSEAPPDDLPDDTDIPF
jgi:hypothetical protein